MTTGDTYLHRFMASLSYPSLLKAAEADYATEEEQRRYVDGLVTAERALVERLESQFAAIEEQRQYFDFSALEGLLQEADFAKGLRQANADAAQGTLSGELLQKLKLAGAADNENLALGMAERELSRKQLTAAQQETVRGLLTNIPEETIDRLFEMHPPVSAAAGVIGDSEAQAAALLAEVQSNQKTSIVGGAAGLEAVKLRATTPVKGSDVFSFEEEAYQAALTALESGTISREDFDTAEDYETAKRVYAEAKQAGAYENQEQLFFDRSLLESRARLAVLRARAEAIAKPAGLSRQQQVQRLVMERRGYDMDKRLAAYQKSAYYDVLLAADDMYTAGLENAVVSGEARGGVVMAATTEIQGKVKAYIDLLRDTDGLKPLDVPKTERKLRKLKDLEGVNLQAALAYAIAYNRSLLEGIDTPAAAQAKLDQVKEKKRQQTEAEKLSEEANRQVEAVAETVALEEAQAVVPIMEVPIVYQGARARGATPEEAAAQVSSSPVALRTEEGTSEQQTIIRDMTPEQLDTLKASPRIQAEIARRAEEAEEAAPAAEAEAEVEAVEAGAVQDLTEKELEERIKALKAL